MREIGAKIISNFIVFLLIGCASTAKYETQTLTNFVDRSSLEKIRDDKITFLGVDLDQMKQDKKAAVGIVMSVSNETQGKVQQSIDAEQIALNALNFAEDYLARVKAYRVVMLPSTVSEDDLLTSKQFAGIDYSFIVKMDIILASEVEQKLDHDETMFKTTINWKLIDNRTKNNGLSQTNDFPFIKESLSCKNVTMRKTAIQSVRNRRMAGSDIRNAQNAYNITLENALIEFRAQLVNRIPFGGKISDIRIRDKNLRMTLKSGIESGIVRNMQMLIITEEGDPVAIAQASGGARADTSTLTVWRWLSASLKKEITKAASSQQTDDWLDMDGNALYAVCLGMPTPEKDERTQIQDYK